MENILDFSKPFDINLFDQIINIFCNPSNPQNAQAQAILLSFENNPNSWTVSGNIIDNSTNDQGKFIALLILERLINQRWKVISMDEKNGIKNYVTSKILNISMDATLIQRDRLIIEKLNGVLIAILKQEWPHNWPSFIPDLVASSKRSESICENNMKILFLLSEDIYEYSEDMTSMKAINLKQHLKDQFGEIFGLCQLILDQSTSGSLLTASLRALLGFLRWIPINYIFDTPLIDVITNKFFPADLFRNDSLRCLTEIVNLDDNTHDSLLCAFFASFMGKITTILPINSQLEELYNTFNDDIINFIHHLSEFFFALFKKHLPCLETNCEEFLIQGFQYMVMMTRVREDDKLFKVCVEFWKFHTEVVYFQNSKRYQAPVYSEIHQNVRRLMIDNMAKPEEVVIMEDASGQLIRETVKDTAAIDLYNLMRQTLIYLTHLNQSATEDILYAKMSQFIQGGTWLWNDLNTLCWSLGSISGTMSVEEEKKFLINMVKDLLTLTEECTGRENKAVCASGIMYVVGQYPRFLKAHWKFFRTVIRKLHDFMHESHPGVKDMACDTIRKIVSKCKEELITKHVVDGKEEEMFVREMVESLPSIISELESDQIYSYYGSLGMIIKAISNNTDQKLIFTEAISSVDAKWMDIMTAGRIHPETLRDPATIRLLTHLIRINSAIAETVGPICSDHLSLIYEGLLSLYTNYEQTVEGVFMQNGVVGLSYLVPRLMRVTRRAILVFLNNFFLICNVNPETISVSVEPLFPTVFNGYAQCNLQSKEPLVLLVMGTIVKRMKKLVSSHSVDFTNLGIATTLPLITNNEEDCPTHRQHFYFLLQMLIQHCFQSFFVDIPDSQQLIIDCVLWGIKHVERNVSEESLEILNKLLTNVLETSQLAASFWSLYYQRILSELLYVLTDRCHKNSFHQQVEVLKNLVTIVATNRIKNLLFAPAQFPSITTNIQYVTLYLIDLLSNAFKHVSHDIISTFIQLLFNSYAVNIDDFRVIVRDFLVQMTEFTSENDSELWIAEQEALLKRKQEEAIAIQNAVPGLRPQHETALTLRHDDLDDL